MKSELPVTSSSTTKDITTHNDRVFRSSMSFIILMCFVACFHTLTQPAEHEYTVIPGDCTVKHRDTECSIADFTPFDSVSYDEYANYHRHDLVTFPKGISCITEMPSKTFHGGYLCYHTRGSVTFVKPVAHTVTPLTVHTLLAIIWWFMVYYAVAAIWIYW